MASLSDFPSRAVTVSVGDVKLTVEPINITTLVGLFTRFPDLGKMLQDRKFSVATLLTNSGPLVAAIIAAGCGHPGDAKHEDAASRLALDDQLTIIEVVLKATIPSGIGAFIERLTALGAFLEKGTPSSVPSIKAKKGH
jgi:hypothetical protein